MTRISKTVHETDKCGKRTIPTIRPEMTRRACTRTTMVTSNSARRKFLLFSCSVREHEAAFRASERNCCERNCVISAGGPGSGKVTHCDNLMIEKRGIVHINMTDLLQQYTVGNGEARCFIFFFFC